LDYIAVFPFVNISALQLPLLLSLLLLLLLLLLFCLLLLIEVVWRWLTAVFLILPILFAREREGVLLYLFAMRGPVKKKRGGKKNLKRDRLMKRGEGMDFRSKFKGA
jgi:hypothetical protein